MKVFMSWSGNRSRATAELLCDWIKCVLQASRPWISSRGIDRGALWFSEINNELKDTSVGIICLTQENKNKPWILFEAGALAKGLATNRVCTFLIDMESSDLQDPLAQFNHTFPNKDSVWNLVLTLNSSLEENALDGRVLDAVFETYWPQFEAKFAQILLDHPPVTVVAPRDEKDMLSEILDTIRGINHRVRTIEANSDPFATSSSEKAVKTYVSGALPKLIELIQGGASEEEAHSFANRAGLPRNVTRNLLLMYRRNPAAAISDKEDLDA